jgi:hypothetical protein
MASRKTTALRHVFGGGWATDFGPSVDGTPDGNRVVIPFLVDAQDCMFELDGGPRKMGGASKVNASAVESGAVVTGLHDYWRQGAAGAPSRRRVIHAGTKVLADADDAVFSNELFTGLEADKVPSYFTFDDLLIISSDSTVDVPRSWDQTTAQNLAGTPPRFSFGCAHKNRAWAAGVYANPSRLYYSVNVDPEDWAGSGSGSIDIDPNDGDIITGIASHKKELWVFKGPNKGSIHRITGSSPTGDDAFAREPFLSKGPSACWHNAIFTFGDDLGYVSQFGSVHSLSATAAYGDFLDAALSRPINNWLRDHLNFNRLRNIWAATDPLRGVVFITMSIDSSTTNNFMLIIDYRNAPNVIRLSNSISHKHASLSLFVDTNGVRRVLGGGNDGFVRRVNVADRSIDGATALSFRVRTPTMNYGEPFMMKQLEGAAFGIAPKGDATFTFGWTRDNNAQQTVSIDQGGGNELDSFVLDDSVLGVLGGASFVDKFDPLGEAGGEFRSIQYDFTQAGVNEEVELHGFAMKITPAGESMENQ